MVYLITIEKQAEKFLLKLDNSIQKEIDNLIQNHLKYKPFPTNKKHILDSSGDVLLCELAHKKYRLYYEYKDGAINISGIYYEGVINILKGSSNQKSESSKNFSNQRELIKRLKKNFNSKFKKK
ncbi:MAG: hypothetical protein ACLFPL_04260 [Candidatus Nanoarchaeia archaeon]